MARRDSQALSIDAARQKLIQKHGWTAQAVDEYAGLVAVWMRQRVDDGSRATERWRRRLERAIAALDKVIADRDRGWLENWRRPSNLNAAWQTFTEIAQPYWQERTPAQRGVETLEQKRAAALKLLSVRVLRDDADMPGPTELALLAVVAEVDTPTTDVDEWAKRVDVWDHALRYVNNMIAGVIRRTNGNTEQTPSA